VKWTFETVSPEAGRGSEQQSGEHCRHWQWDCDQAGIRCCHCHTHQVAE